MEDSDGQRDLECTGWKLRKVSYIETDKCCSRPFLLGLFDVPRLMIDPHVLDISKIGHDITGAAAQIYNSISLLWPDVLRDDLFSTSRASE